MRVLPYFGILATAALVATTFLPRYAPSPLRPDLILICVVFAASRAKEESRALFLGWTSGLVKDLLCAGAPGMYALLYLACAAGILRLRTVLNVRLPLVGGGLILAAALVTEGVWFLTHSREWTWPGATALRSMLISSAVTAVLAPAVWSLLHRLRGWLCVASPRLEGPHV